MKAFLIIALFNSTILCYFNKTINALERELMTINRFLQKYSENVTTRKYWESFSEDIEKISQKYFQIQAPGDQVGPRPHHDGLWEVLPPGLWSLQKNNIIIIIMFCLQWKEFQENVRHSYKEVKHKSVGGWEGISYPCHVYAKINFLF